MSGKWWEIESDLAVRPTGQAVDIERFTYRCSEEFTRAGAIDAVLTGNPAEGKVTANFVMNSASVPAEATANALGLLQKVASGLQDGWDVRSTSVDVSDIA